MSSPSPEVCKFSRNARGVNHRRLASWPFPPLARDLLCQLWLPWGHSLPSHVGFPARHDVSSALTLHSGLLGTPTSHFLSLCVCLLSFPGDARPDQRDLELDCETEFPREQSAHGLPPVRNETEVPEVPRSPVHTLCMDIPGGPWGKCQLRTKHQAASCDTPTSPGGWRRGSQEAGIERQSAYTLGMQGQPGHQAADSHKDGVEAEVKGQ